MNVSQALVPSTNRAGQLALPQPPQADDRLDLSESLNFFARWYGLILGVAVAVTLLGVGISLLTPKTYRAQATVVIDKGAENVNQAAPSPNAKAVVSKEVVETQVEIITSREMTERVLSALHYLDGKSSAERKAIEESTRKRVAATRSGDSYALQITFDAREPEEAARVVNEFARQYSNWELNEDQRRNQQARDIIQQRLEALRDEAQADTQALQQYRIANNLLSTSGASLTEQEISTYEQQVAQARAAAAEDAARLSTAQEQLRSGSSGEDVGEALDSPVISSLRQQEATAAAEVADLSSRYGPNHPELIRATSKLKEVRSQIQDEIGRVISNLRARQDVSQQRLASLDGSLGQANHKLSQNNAAMVGLSELERKAAASQDIYETYLGSYKQLIAAEGSERPSAKIVTEAAPPSSPMSPNLKLNILLSLVTGLGLGVLAAFIAEALSHGVTRTEEVETDLGERFLGSVPLLSSSGSASPHAISAIRDEPKSVFAESFRGLTASIEQFANADDAVIAVTSALPGEGKTVISCCLAHTLATKGLRTVLIDCDLRRRGISKLLGVKASQAGFIEVLNGHAPLIADNVSEEYVFCIIPISPSDEEPETLLTGEPFRELIAQLREKFDRIVLDLPPVLPIANARQIAEAADSVVFVVNWRKTPKAAVRAALKRLPEELVNIAGVVLNKVDMRRRAHFGAEDPGYYYSRYSEYYT